MKKETVIEKIDYLFLNGIAHRGYHNESFSENGINAFKNAIDNLIPFELDVHLCKSGELVVMHDANLKRMSAKEGIIEELTLQEIKDNYSLPDGSKIPTLSEVLALNNETVPMVIELKVYKGNYQALAKRTKIELKNIKDKKKYMLISFDPRVLLYFKKFGIVRSLLIGKEHQWTFMLRHFFESLDIDVKLLKYPKYRKYNLKHFTNCWTVESFNDLRNVYCYVDTLTFQNIKYDQVSTLLATKRIK